MVGADELVAAILDSKGKAIDFNACLATPGMMPKLVKLGRLLGPKGLMPNPKVRAACEPTHTAILSAAQFVSSGVLHARPARRPSWHAARAAAACAALPPTALRRAVPRQQMGSLTDDVGAAVARLRRGQLAFRMDRTAIVHAPIGRVNFEPSALYANMGALAAALLAAKPEAIRGGLPKYVRSVALASSMGRGVPVEVSSLVAAMDAAAAALAAQGAQ